MRNLTIKRVKKYTASLMKMKVYIEDPVCAEMLINNVPCRKLGDLKNGEEKTFQIGEGEAKVFVIADKLSKNICNEFVQIPAGTEDVYLSGRNHLNPMAGNPFRFDGFVTEEVLQNRKKGTRKTVIVMCAAVVVGLIIGIISGFSSASNKPEKPEPFSAEGMNITLTDAFEQAEYDGYTACFESDRVAVFALKEEFSLLEGFSEYTLDDYAELVFSVNAMDSTVKKVDGLTCFEYTAVISDETVVYYAFLYKADDAFWMINFAVPEEDSAEYYDKIVEWAKSVDFGA